MPRTGDVLGGHKDDVEADMALPIVSVSLGCEAVFLMGGPTRDTRPTALRLRSGDVLVLAGQARACYHGGWRRGVVGSGHTVHARVRLCNC
jgi:alkylated DNA repair protein alkB family protein 1